MDTSYPYPDAVLAAILREALPENVTVETQLDDELLRRLPYVFVEATGGTDLDPLLASHPSVQVVSYAKGSKRDGARLAEACRTALVRAHESQRIYEGASVARVRAEMLPFEQPQENQPTDVFRFVGRFNVILRPAKQG